MPSSYNRVDIYKSLSDHLGCTEIRCLIHQSSNPLLNELVGTEIFKPEIASFTYIAFGPY